MAFILAEIQHHFFQDYLILSNEKINFFRQHNLWKYKNMLIKLFDYPETIRNLELFEFNLFVLENIIKENR